MQSDDLRPDTRGGDTWTVLLLTLCNLVVPLLAYIWGVVRLSQTDRWNKLQKLALLLILPGFFAVGFILAWPISSSTKVVSVRALSPVTSPGTQLTPANVRPVAITTLMADGNRTYLAAVTRDVRFEARDGCLYVGGDQAVWFFGTVIRPKPGTAEYEVLDTFGRKLAETGTTVDWGGGQVSASEAKTTAFTDKLSIGAECKMPADSYWLVGQIRSPRFQSNNTEPAPR